MKQYVWAMRILAVIYVAVGGIFFLAPSYLIETINGFARVIAVFSPKLTPYLGAEMPQVTEHFFATLATAMMVMLVLTALYSSFYPRTKGYLALHLASKITSIACFFQFFLIHKQFAYLFGSIIDTFVLLYVLIFYFRSLRKIVS